MISRSWLVPGDRSDRQLLAIVCVTTLVVTAGCAGLLDDGTDDSADEDELTAQVPANATALAHLNGTAIDDADEAVLTDLAEVTDDPRAIETQLVAVEDRTGLDPLVADSVLVFEMDGPTDETGETHTAAIVDGDWTDDDVVAAVESATDLEYDWTDENLAVPISDVDEPIAIGAHDDGRYVVGDEPAVMGSLAVGDGDGEAASGPIPAAVEQSNTPVSVAQEQSDSIVPADIEDEAPSFMLDPIDDIELLIREYSSAEEGLSIDVGLYVGDEESAATVEDVMPGALAFLAESELTDDAAADAVDEIAIDREGQTVWLTYTGDVDAIFDLLDEV